MSVSKADIEFALDLFAPLGGISSRKMMGGLMIYSHGQVFALLGSSGTLYLKASGGFADELATHGARLFSMVNKDGKTHTMGYWTLPEPALDDPEEACDWARKALDQLT
jgi:DNA transformation protein and related proteins